MAVVTILDAIRDRGLLGAVTAFSDLSTWGPWLTFLAAVYGLPLDSEGLELFKRCTGRSRYDPPPGGWREVVAIPARQSGKTRIASAIATFEAVTAPRVTDGEMYSLLIAQDLRAAVRTSFSYIRAFFDASPLLRRSIVNRTADTLELDNGLRLAAYSCRPAAVRGLRARCVVVDELAYFVTSDARRTDTEMLRTTRPTLATTGGRIIILSSPDVQAGELWDLNRRHHGRDDSDTLVWQASAPTMNPTLPVDYLARMEQDDPEAYRSEVLGEFRAGVASLLDPEALEACVATDRRELPPAEGLDYEAFVDPSGGRRDAFTCAIAHKDGERIVVDVVRAWPAPFNPAGVTEECAELLKCYRVDTVVGDRYAGEWPREAFRSHGITYDLAALDRSRLYVELVPAVNAARVEIPDDPALLRELRGLERRRGSSGRDRVDHRPGAHDDRSNALAGVVHMLRREVVPLYFACA